MEWFAIFFEAFIDLNVAMAPYILFGLAFAGILHETIPESLVTRHLGGRSVASVAKATLFGIPLPVCSCGVIPLASSIHKSGAGSGATLAFLISTPITGVDAILATYGMFGWTFTLYRVVTSMILATLAGVLANRMAADVSTEPAPTAACCGTSCCNSTAETKRRFSLRAAIHYGFITLLGDIARPLLWGLVIGALITTLIPQELGLWLTRSPWLSYLIAVAVAVPMYVCATASLPIAAGLVLAGVSPGAAFVFLSAGPATNVVTMSVVRSMLGTGALIIYLSTIALGSIAFGVLLDTVFDDLQIAEQVMRHEENGLFALGASVVMLGLLGYHMVPRGVRRKM